MDTDKKGRVELLEESLTEKILGGAFKVHNALGYGFLEKVYENALTVELTRTGVSVEQQKTIPVHYEGVVVGNYLADIVVGGRVILEIKAARQSDPAHEAQLLNYLKATGLRVGLLFNFGRSKLQYKRYVV